MHLRSVVAAIIFLSASLAARANTLTENYTVSGISVLNDSGLSGVTSTSFSQFDTSLGTLNSISIALSGEATSYDDGAVIFLAVGVPNDQHHFLLSGDGFMYGMGPFTVFVNGNFSDSYYLSIFEGTGTEALVLDFDLGLGTVTADGVPGTLTYNYTPVAATPEPASLVLLSTGLLGVAGTLRRRFA